MLFEVEFRGEEEERNMSGADSIDFKKKTWNDSPIIAEHFLCVGMNE